MLPLWLEQAELDREPSGDLDWFLLVTSDLPGERAPLCEPWAFGFICSLVETDKAISPSYLPLSATEEPELVIWGGSASLPLTASSLVQLNSIWSVLTWHRQKNNEISPRIAWLLFHRKTSNPDGLLYWQSRTAIFVLDWSKNIPQRQECHCTCTGIPLQQRTVSPNFLMLDPTFWRFLAATNSAVEFFLSGEYQCDKTNWCDLAGGCYLVRDANTKGYPGKQGPFFQGKKLTLYGSGHCVVAGKYASSALFPLPAAHVSSLHHWKYNRQRWLIQIEIVGWMVGHWPRWHKKWQCQAKLTIFVASGDNSTTELVPRSEPSVVRISSCQNLTKQLENLNGGTLCISKTW